MEKSPKKSQNQKTNELEKRPKEFQNQKSNKLEKDRKEVENQELNEPSSMSRARRVILTAILLASTIVLSRFIAIRTPIITINFAFLPIMLAGMLLGWKGSTFVAVVADLIGAILFPSGSFFIGYTLTALLKGLSAGLLLYNKNGVEINKKFVLRLVICILIWSVILNGALNTLWIFITSATAANIIVPVRIAKQLVMAPIQFILIMVIAKIFQKKFNQLMVIDTRDDENEDN